VLHTQIPWAVAASTSILLYPTPKFANTRHVGAAAAHTSSSALSPTTSTASQPRTAASSSPRLNAASSAGFTTLQPASVSVNASGSQRLITTVALSIKITSLSFYQNRAARANLLPTAGNRLPPIIKICNSK
jgi:hypothetical protein